MLTLDLAAPRVDGAGFCFTATDSAAHPGEVELAATLPSARRGDFLLGRAALRSALTEIGVSAGPIGFDGRKPRLPDGVVASISHSGGRAVALAGPRARFATVGVDFETVPLPPAAARYVLGPSELDWVFADDLLAEAFSAKEAVFKAAALLDGGELQRLKDIMLCPGEAGFTAFIRTRPGLALPVRVRRYGTAVLAWTALHSTLSDAGDR
ncbi:4'-phosphopantetheinyl transferase superfamily protein [Amycolatopsis xylanica]|uniref:4'-phosphopantetheinyl transferase superfamily protein n=1 Tax=Amycolatopsis xylanica TaxID=589385 RepID=A0A1H2WAQ3_9PSEU|nr:4'-phosphopantetheinyl transferase superfamily protein [Amycolatopsis xylanica]SDW77598.1 4'-phosphopantetheinyl transferase superfamily protein [Amycolatopsis xylanica]